MRRRVRPQTLDDIGAIIERTLNDVEGRLGQHHLGSIFLGFLLATCAIVAGLAAFVVVLIVLVTLFS
jgi:hypothetical protein